MRFALLLCYILASFTLSAKDQALIRGEIIDMSTKAPIVGARVELTNFTPRKALYTDAYGRFEFKDLPYGRHRMQISATGYRPMLVSDIELNAGGSINLSLSLEALPRELGPERFRPDASQIPTLTLTTKDRANNEMELGAIRLLSTNEVNRFAGDRNEISRLVANYAGLRLRNDYKDHLSIRGNSPAFMQWRLEGSPIPQPSHLGDLGTNGGYFNVLSPFVVENSDLLATTSSAEYSGVLGGFFDVKLRKGNPNRFGFLFQASTISGAQFIFEGPLHKRSQSSFLISVRAVRPQLNYVRSFLERLSTQGQQYPMPTSYPLSRDILWNFNFPKTPIGKLEFYGILGSAERELDGINASPEDLQHDYDLNKGHLRQKNSVVNVVGLKHFAYLSQDKQAYVQTNLSTTRFTFSDHMVWQTEENPYYTPLYSLYNGNSEVHVQSHVHHNVSSNLAYRVGGRASYSFWQIQEVERQLQRVGSRTVYQEQAVYLLDAKLDTFNLSYQSFGELLWKPSPRFKVNAGLAWQYNQINQRGSLEPRLSMRYLAQDKHQFYLGYGLYAQNIPIQSLAQMAGPTRRAPYFTYPMMRSHNLSLGYILAPEQDWRIKVEGYGQYYFDIPSDTANYANSMLNFGNGMLQTDSRYFSPEGTGYLIGGDVSIEKFFSDNYYLTFTSSYVHSHSIGKDGLHYPTAFDYGFGGNLLVGKEFSLGKGNNKMNIDFKMRLAEGEPIFRIDSLASSRTGYTLYREDLGLVDRLPYYWRSDLRISFVFNSPKSRLSQRIYFDFINILNHKNLSYPFYDFNTQRINYLPDMPVLLDFMYQLRF